jgi:hypothetical protein
VLVAATAGVDGNVDLANPPRAIARRYVSRIELVGGEVVVSGHSLFGNAIPSFRAPIKDLTAAPFSSAV